VNQNSAVAETNQSRVAIIGGGFTGAMLAAQLLRQSSGSESVVLIDRCTRLGLGVAYGTRSNEHLLNVRARNMSAYPDDSEHFLGWARLNYQSSVTPDDYLPRAVYGRYIKSLLEQEIERHPGQFEHVQDEAVSLSRFGDMAEIHLSSGKILFSDRVVLALGNFPPANPRLAGRTEQSRRYVSNPWTAAATDGLENAQSVLLIGSGLTSVDIAISLQERGFRGEIHILSRHGLLPQTHVAHMGTDPWPAFWDTSSPRTVRGLMRLIRPQAQAAERAGSGWRAVMDALRPVTQEIWRSLPLQEQRRFLRHVRPYWDVHRHRVAPAIGSRLALEAQHGQIETHAGRIVEYAEDPAGVDISYRERQTGELKRLRVDRVINCTGPESDCRKVDSPLLTSLMQQRLARPDPLSLGLDVSPDGGVIDAQGVASNLIYAIGPIRKGNLWETIAVPDIRIQVLALSKVLLAACEEVSAKRKAKEPIAAISYAEYPRAASPRPAYAGQQGGSRYFEQFYLGCLAHASYMLASEGEAVVVDPQRDVEIYLKAAERRGLKIRHIFETHAHADFVSGHKELAARTGARIYIGPNGRASFPHAEVHDGFELRVGTMGIKVLETPGHSLDSICLVVTDEKQSPHPWAVLTGDTLFLGDVGRPDLSTTHSAQALAGMLYSSLHDKLLKLRNDVLVYPAHGAGSLCGRNMRADRFSTIGAERLTNYALQIKNKEEFVTQLTTNLPPRPAYFPQDAQINRTGAPALSDLPSLTPLSPSELQSLIDEHATVLDVRSGDQFASGHVPGSINIPLSGQFASWAGIVLGLSSRPALIADSPAQLAEARMRLARVGIDDAHGYLQDGTEGWKKAGQKLTTLPQISVKTLHERMQTDRLQILDVRREPEWQAGHISAAACCPLEDFKDSLPELDRFTPIAILCKGGYRSMIASSLLRRAGFQDVTNVIGGFEAWEKARLPFVTESLTTA
jgi:hydroxyacylglutathione hydrolase